MIAGLCCCVCVNGAFDPALLANTAGWHLQHPLERATKNGFGVLFVPHLFHGTSGIVVPEDVNLLNEIRAPGGLLLAAVVSSVAFLSFGESRLVGMMFEGMPDPAIIQIMVFELFIVGALPCIAEAASRDRLMKTWFPRRIEVVKSVMLT